MRSIVWRRALLLRCDWLECHQEKCVIGWVLERWWILANRRKEAGFSGWEFAPTCLWSSGRSVCVCCPLRGPLPGFLRARVSSAPVHSVGETAVSRGNGRDACSSSDVPVESFRHLHVRLRFALSADSGWDFYSVEICRNLTLWKESLEETLLLLNLQSARDQCGETDRVKSLGFGFKNRSVFFKRNASLHVFNVYSWNLPEYEQKKWE